MNESYRTRPRDEATERIECYILENNLAPHAKLPSERDMCEMWGYNRTTLRSAVKRLMVEGKLYNRKGSGTYVAPPKMERNLQDAKSTSEAILAAGHKPDTQTLCLQTIVCDKHVAQRLQMQQPGKVLYLRRLRVMDGKPVTIETSYMDMARCPSIERYDFYNEPLYEILAQCGIVVDNGHEHVGITYATPEEAQLLQVEEGAPLFYLSGVAYDRQNCPIEYFKSVSRADRLRFSSVLTR